MTTFWLCTVASIAAIGTFAKENIRDTKSHDSIQNEILSLDLGSLFSMAMAQTERLKFDFMNWISVEDAYESSAQYSGCLTAVQIILDRESIGQSKEQESLSNLLQNAAEGTEKNGNSFVSCQSLTDENLEKECDEVLEKHVEEVLVALKQGKAMDGICEEIMASKQFDEGEIMVISITNVDSPTKIDEIPEASAFSCKVCSNFVKIVDDAIKEDFEKVEELREVIGDICDSLSSDSLCHLFLNQYDQIVKWLKDGSDPKTICKEISMCINQSSQDQVSSDLAPENLLDGIALILGNQPLPLDDTDDHGCMYCISITQVVEFVDKNQRDYLETVRKIIKYACKLTPKGCGCDELEKHFDEIIQMVEQGKKPQEICESIGMCKKVVQEITQYQSSSAVMPLMQQLDSSMLENMCMFCDSITMMIRVVLEEKPEDIDQVRTYADMVCDLLGEDSPCHVYVKQLDQVVDDLKAGKHPREICVSLKYCDKKDEKLQLTLQPNAIKSWSSCLFCDVFAEFLSLSTDLKNVLPIKRAITALCVIMPPDTRCSYLNSKFEDLLEQLRQGVSPMAACGKIDACSALVTTAPGLKAEDLNLAAMTTSASEIQPTESSTVLEIVVSKE